MQSCGRTLSYLWLIVEAVSAQGYMGTPMGVDRVETVDVTSNQIVVTTTKVGPVETLQVFIDVVDIENGIHLPPMNLSGLLLMITRGRYTVNFLRPSTWYGVSFLSEQNTPAMNGQRQINYEQKLVRTLPSPEMPPSVEDTFLEKPPIEVTVTRGDKHGKSVENLVVALKWILPRAYRTNLQATANLSLLCTEQTRYKELKLADEESQKSVEVKLENTFEVRENHNITRQVVASIQPRNCHRLCWTTFIKAPFENHNFEHEIGKDCRSIEPVTATANMRDYLSYDVSRGDLTVHTNTSNDGVFENALVEVRATAIPDGLTHIDNSTVHVATFQAHHNVTDFVVHHLDPTKWYAVQYSYARKTPFAYIESQRFLVESSATAARAPFRVRFATFDTVNGSASLPLKPHVVMSLDPAYKNSSVGVDVEPFCNATHGEHFWLTPEESKHELRGLALLRALCAERAEHALCGGKKDESSHVLPNGVNDTKCPSTKLCYTGNLKLDNKVYSMRRRCIDIANYFPIMEAEADKLHHNTAALGAPSLFSVLLALLLSAMNC